MITAVMEMRASWLCHLRAYSHSSQRSRRMTRMMRTGMTRLDQSLCLDFPPLALDVCAAVVL